MGSSYEDMQYFFVQFPRKTSFTLDLEVSEFSSTKLGEKGKTVQRRKDLKGGKLYKEIWYHKFVAKIDFRKYFKK